MPAIAYSRPARRWSWYFVNQGFFFFFFWREKEEVPLPSHTLSRPADWGDIFFQNWGFLIYLLFGEIIFFFWWPRRRRRRQGEIFNFSAMMVIAGDVPWDGCVLILKAHASSIRTLHTECQLYLAMQKIYTFCLTSPTYSPKKESKKNKKGREKRKTSVHRLLSKRRTDKKKKEKTKNQWHSAFLFWLVELAVYDDGANEISTLSGRIR